ncbi:MAG: bifunctional phosphoribosylaminoimidazolecarboxamide formyltransferase/IMP cyclohydrolase [Rhodothermales bacterium]
MIKEKDLPKPEDLYPVRRALLSVSDKTGLVDFAKRLHAQGVEMISTGGTARALKEAGIPVSSVSDITKFPEILDGRVKTLHPAIHGGLLSRKNDPEDLAELEKHQIKGIDLVVVNLYPFQKAIQKQDISIGFAIENIDIGGPTMIRAAAKNFFFVGVITSPADYDSVAEELEQRSGALSMHTRQQLAATAFAHTAQYDTAIAGYFSENTPSKEGAEEEAAAHFGISLPRVQSLRYGENPHQKAAFYGDPSQLFDQLHGKALSFNNLIDLSAALFLIDEFRDSPPTCAILKHTNPCGVASSESLLTAYKNAFATDRQSPFGGIVVVNQTLDLATAEAIDSIFTEIIIAPEFGEGVLDFLMKKKNRRLIKSKQTATPGSQIDIRSIAGGILVQDRDQSLPPLDAFRSQINVVTERQPTPEEWLDLIFAWRVVKHVKSNAIVYARNAATLGVGAGQMSRIDSSEIAVQKGRKSELDFTESVVASDAFFPFADGLIEAAKNGARAAIQPGGSIRDDEVIQAANAHGMTMVFTGKRHFRH